MPAARHHHPDALNGVDQVVLSGSLVLIPPQPAHIFAGPLLQQRFVRVQVPACCRTTPRPCQAA